MDPVGDGLDMAALPVISVEELAENYEILSTNEGVIVVTPITQLADVTTQSTPGFGEIGFSSMTSYGSIFRDEYNSDLRGLTGLMKYDRMRRSDGQVQGILRLIKTPVLAARWYVATDEETELGEQQTEFVQQAMFNWMTSSWPQMLTEMLLMLEFGYYAFEKVFTERQVKGKTRVIWQKWAARHPMDAYRWVYDSKGGPRSLEMYPPVPAMQNVTIPIEKLLVFTNQKEGGNMEGLSILRPAYKHWFYKENLYKIDAIQKERHGIGIPVIKLPPGYTPTDKARADELGRNIRTNEKAHIVVPVSWEVATLKIEGQPVSALNSIEHHDLLIARMVLGQFLNDPSSRSSEDQQDIFVKSTRFIAETIRDTINKHAIPELIKFNWGEQESYPELRVRRIGDTVDWRTISFALRNFVGAGIIQPDDPLEKWIRDEMDLPPADVASARIIVTPQMPPPDGPPDSRPGPGGAATDTTKGNAGAGMNVQPAQAGPPRQSPAGGMRSAQSPGSPNSGRDRSGGR